ncbi:MAG: WD40 repeat domain-containing protein [Planctomycetota bacterium]|nr:MAG: WD40 repeat domain-containing protein [Planctomycetota bacterium]
MTRCLLILLLTVPAANAADVVIPNPSDLGKVSADRSRLVVSGPDDTEGVELWDLDTRKLRHRIGAGEPTALAISSSGNLVASGDEEGQVTVWNAEDGSEVASLSIEGKVRFLTLSDDGAMLACRGESPAIDILSVSNAEKLASITPDSDLTVLQVAQFNPDGSFWAVFGTGVYYWEKGADPRKLSEESPLTDATVSPNAEVVAARAGDEILLWTAEGKQDYIDAEDEVNFQFSNDGRRLLVLRSDQKSQTADVWSWADGWGNFGIDTSIEGIHNGLFVLSASGGQCAYAVADTRDQRVAVRQVAEGELTLLADDYRTTERQFPVSGITFAPGNNRVLVQRDWLRGKQEVRGVFWYLWDLAAETTTVALPSRRNEESKQIREQTPQVIARSAHDEKFDAIEFVGGGNTILARAETQLHLFNAESELPERPARRWKFERSGELFGATIKEFDISPDNKWLAIDSNRGQLALFDVPSGTLKYMMPISDLYNLGFSADSRKLTLLASHGWSQVDMLSLRTSEIPSNTKRTDQPLDDRYLYPVRFNSEPDTQCLISAKDGSIARQVTPTKVNRSGQYALSSDNTRFAIMARRLEGRGFGIEVFDLQEGGSRYVAVDLDSYLDIEFAPSNDQLIVATGDAIVTVNWRRNRVERLYPPEEGGLYGVGVGSTLNYVKCFNISSTGLLAAGGYDGQIMLVDYEKQELIGVLVDRDEEVQGVQFSPDGRHLFASYKYHTALYDLEVDMPDQTASLETAP